ncbi:MAG: helix-turn-helix domain-containing protein [Clostridium sp.]|nr:helix-turn-helix domain-containing protein [Clostridium sp.]
MNLKQIRTERGMTIPKLVEVTGIPKRTIEDIQKRGDCLVSNAIKLAKALGVTLDELCWSDDEKTSE